MKRIAVDLAKSVYQVAESVRSGQVVQRKRLNREAFRRYIQEQAEPVEWVMEACGTAHYWGRLAKSLGHRVKLLPPRYVRPYSRRNKTDRNDCNAILEAVPLSRLLHTVLAEINLDEQCMAECEQQLKRWHADDDIVRKLDVVGGIGLLTASALTAVVGKPRRFANGRQL
ncbi:transposase [Pseudomonas sp. 3400]|nr:transposase [Pseudomonas sp. 3400]MDR7013557.1 transposase [Pseudomonas alcaliphila]